MKRFYTTESGCTKQIAQAIQRSMSPLTLGMIIKACPSRWPRQKVMVTVLRLIRRGLVVSIAKQQPDRGRRYRWTDDDSEIDCRSVVAALQPRGLRKDSQRAGAVPQPRGAGYWDGLVVALECCGDSRDAGPSVAGMDAGEEK